MPLDSMNGNSSAKLDNLGLALLHDMKRREYDMHRLNEV